MKGLLRDGAIALHLRFLDGRMMGEVGECGNVRRNFGRTVS